jgi:hypothetical protein
MEEQMTFDQTNSTYRAQLETKYPINNHALYPGKRIYLDEQGHAFELNMTRLDIWAAHLVF